MSLSEVEELNVKHECGVGRDAAGDTLGAVTHVGADSQLRPLPLGHLGHSVIPTSDHLRQKKWSVQ